MNTDINIPMHGNSRYILSVESTIDHHSRFDKHAKVNNIYTFNITCAQQNRTDHILFTVTLCFKDVQNFPPKSCKIFLTIIFQTNIPPHVVNTTNNIVMTSLMSLWCWDVSIL